MREKKIIKLIFLTLALIIISFPKANAIPAEGQISPRSEKGYGLYGSLSLSTDRIFGGELYLSRNFTDGGMGLNFFGLSMGYFSEDQRFSTGLTAAYIGIISGRATLSYSWTETQRATDLKLAIGALLLMGYVRLQRTDYSNHYIGEIGLELNFPIWGKF